MTLELQISLLSALAAIGSAYWAWSSAKSARRALALSEEDADTKKENLKAYLINALRWEHSENEYISFSCSYTNSSSYPSTVARFDLIVHGFDLDGAGSNVRLDPEDRAPKGSEFSPIPIPLNLSARATYSGWLTFRLPKKWTQKFIVDKFELVATTWSGQKISIESHIVLKQGQDQ